ncbi:hypothetical protein [Qipengyuania sp. 483]
MTESYHKAEYRRSSVASERHGVRADEGRSEKCEIDYDERLPLRRRAVLAPQQVKDWGEQEDSKADSLGWHPHILPKHWDQIFDEWNRRWRRKLKEEAADNQPGRCE